MNENTVNEHELETVSPSRMRITVEIPADEVDREYEKILKKYIAVAKVPGFRKGHAPIETVKKGFDEDIRHDLYDELIPRALETRLETSGVRPVNSPKVTNIEHEMGKPLAFTAEFEIIPDFDLPDPSEIEIKGQNIEATEEEIAKAIEDIRARAAEYLPVADRDIIDGDYVVVDIQGRDLKLGHMLPAEKAVVLAGNVDNVPGLNEALAGLKAGEAGSFKTTYDKEHPNKRLAGKEVEYKVSVKEVKEKKLPAVDDEFARSLGNYAGLSELKDKIKLQIIQAGEREDRARKTREILNAMASTIQVEVPESMVEAETVAILDHTLKSLPGEALSQDLVEKLKVEAKKQAVEHVTHHLILDRLAEKEGMKATDEDIKKEIDRVAGENNVPPAAVEEYLRKEDKREDLVEGIVFRKSVDFLLGKAIIK